MTEGIRVVGLDQFARDLRRVDKDAARELAKSYRLIARDVRERSRARARQQSAAYAKAAAGIQSRASAKDARIRITGRRYPWIFGQEFGAYRNLERQIRYGESTRTIRGWNQFPPWRGNRYVNASNTGYAVYPTIRDRTPYLVDEVERAMDRSLAAAFPDKG